MADRSLGRVLIGTLLAVLGTVLLVSGLLRAGATFPDYGPVPGWGLTGATGFVLFLVGASVALPSSSTREEAVPPVPADVAFASRPPPGAFPLPEPPARNPARAPTPTRLTSPSTHAAAKRVRSGPTPPKPAAAAAAQGQAAPQAAHDPLVAHLSDEIRDLTRKINRAGVLLATGQLSDEGYAAYVGDLKRRRAELETQRVQVELQRKV